MNIYDFFYSKDIAEHCQNIGHQFSPLDMTVITYLSKNPISAKHLMYRHIIAEYSDMPIHKSVNFDARDSLHDYLRELMEYEERGIQKVTTAEPGAVFRARVRCLVTFSGECDYREINGCFSTYEKAVAAVHENWNWTEDKVRFSEISKEFINKGNSSRSVRLNENDEIIELNYYEEDELDLPDMIFFHLPVPFVKGDLVRFNSIYSDDKPFVLDWLPHWLDNDRRKYEDYVTGRRGDGSDMCAGVYYMAEGGLTRDDGPPYALWQMCYCEAELVGEDRFLKHLSQYTAQNIDAIDWLLAVYMKYHTEAENKKWSSLFGGWFLALDSEV